MSGLHIGGKLQRDYLRVCSIHRLLKAKRIGQAEALRLSKLPLRGNAKPRDITGTIGLWKANHIRDMLP